MRLLLMVKKLLVVKLIGPKILQEQKNFTVMKENGM